MMSQSPADHVSHITNVHSLNYTQIVSQLPETKRRWRRRKSEPGELRKNKLSTEQVSVLETRFEDDHKLESERKDKLAAELRLNPRQVAVWFQNRRTRWKNKKLEEEYSKFKNLYNQIIVDKYHIESEVLKLKEKLTEAEAEIQRLSVSVGAGNSLRSPHSVDVTIADQQQFFGNQLEMGFDELFYTPVENYGYEGDNWINLFD